MTYIYKVKFFDDDGFCIETDRIGVELTDEECELSCEERSNIISERFEVAIAEYLEDFGYYDYEETLEDVG